MVVLGVEVFVLSSLQCHRPCIVIDLISIDGLNRRCCCCRYGSVEEWGAYFLCAKPRVVGRGEGSTRHDLPSSGTGTRSRTSTFAFTTLTKPAQTHPPLLLAHNFGPLSYCRNVTLLQPRRRAPPPHHRHRTSHISRRPSWNMDHQVTPNCHRPRLLQPSRRRVHRARQDRHLLLLHRGRLLRGGLLPRHRQPC